MGRGRRKAKTVEAAQATRAKEPPGAVHSSADLKISTRDESREGRTLKVIDYKHEAKRAWVSCLTLQLLIPCIWVLRIDIC